jgi:outer membrane autotransporter protein
MQFGVNARCPKARLLSTTVFSALLFSFPSFVYATCVATSDGFTTCGPNSSGQPDVVFANKIHLLSGSFIEDDPFAQASVPSDPYSIYVPSNLITDAGSIIHDTPLPGTAVIAGIGSSLSLTGNITATQNNAQAVTLGANSSLILYQGGTIQTSGFGTRSPNINIGIAATGNGSNIEIAGTVKTTGIYAPAIYPFQSTLNSISGSVVSNLYTTSVVVDNTGSVQTTGSNSDAIRLGGGSSLTINGVVSTSGANSSAIRYDVGTGAALPITIGAGATVSSSQAPAIIATTNDAVANLTIAGTISGPGSNQVAVQLGAGSVTQVAGSSVTGTISVVGGARSVHLTGSAAAPSMAALYSGFQSLLVDPGYWVIGDSAFNTATISAGATLELRPVYATLLANQIVDNGTLIYNGSTVAGPTVSTISGSGGLTVAGGALTFNTVATSATYTGLTSITGGALTLTGGNVFQADTNPVSVTGGSLILQSNQNIGDLSGGGSGVVALGSNTLSTNGDGASTTFSGVITGTGGLIKRGAGVLSLTGASSFSGLTTVSSGALTLGGPVSAIPSSSVLINAGAALNLSSNQSIADLSGAGNITLGSNILTTNGDGATTTFSGAISGTGGLTKAGGGTLFLTGASNYSGPTTVSAGVLNLGPAAQLSATSAAAVGSGALLVIGSDQTIGDLSGSGGVSLGSHNLTTNGDGATTTFSGAISGTGGLTKAGAGTLFLTGANTYSGNTLVSGGVLSINGSLINSAVQILSGGTLKGSGQITNIIVGSGATIAPGNSIGTINISGNITFGAGSTYQLEVNSNGQSDKIVATGGAVLNGQVQVVAASGVYSRSTQYNIISAAAGVNGSFSGVYTNLAFLTPSLIYGPNGVDLILTNNTVLFQSYASTPNQKAVATALYNSSSTGQVFGALLNQTVASAPAAFDSLSGEIYASTPKLLLNESEHTEDAIVERLSQQRSKGAMAFAPLSTDVTAWLRAYGAWGRTGAQAGDSLASMRSDSAGVTIGIDRCVSGWLLGVAASHEGLTIHMDSRSSQNDVDTNRLALYAGGVLFGPLSGRSGIDYGWSALNASRTVSFPSFSDQDRASYHAGTLHAFGELALDMRLKSITVEPFLSISYAKVDTDRIFESGGAAALEIAKSSNDAVFSSLGVKASAQWSVSNIDVRPYGSLAFQNVDGAGEPSSSVTLVSAQATYAIYGIGIDRDSAKLKTGIDIHRGRLIIGFGYEGEWSRNWQDNQVRATADFIF